MTAVPLGRFSGGPRRPLRRYAGWKEENSMPRKLSNKKKFAFAFLLTVLFGYLIPEALCTAIMPPAQGAIGADTFSIAEDTGGFCIDLVRGYSVTSTPARIARVSRGHVEFVGTLRGNSQGFQGDRDFTVEKPPGVRQRYLVFGDSFTSAAFLKTRWTERAEESLPQTEFVNCALDGAGLANWWSVLTRFIIPNNYQFDGVVFALITNDLERSFVVADSRGKQFSAIGYAGWNPDLFPADVESALDYLSVATLTKVSPSEFDASIGEGRLCRGANPHGHHHPWIATQAATVIERLFVRRSMSRDIRPLEFVPAPHLAPAPANEFFGSYQVAMMLDIRRRLSAKHLPIIVFYIPGRDELLSQRDDSPRVRSFSSLIDAKFVDASQPFRGLNADEVRASYFPVDGHWNQIGSDRFAEFIAEKM
jgi:hypothetical protein